MKENIPLLSNRLIGCHCRGVIGMRGATALLTGGSLFAIHPVNEILQTI